MVMIDDDILLSMETHVSYGKNLEFGGKMVEKTEGDFLCEGKNII